MRVRVAIPADLAMLVAGLPAPPGVHESRLQRQVEGHGDFLVVFDDAGTPVGSAFLKTSGPTSAEVAAVHPEVPELIHMHVSEGARGRGAGTALLDAAHQLASSRGFSELGLSVGLDNPRARALYERHGYADTGTTSTVRYLNGHGREHIETSAFMTRPTNVV